MRVSDRCPRTTSVSRLEEESEKSSGGDGVSEQSGRNIRRYTISRGVGGGKHRKEGLKIIQMLLRRTCYT